MNNSYFPFSNKAILTTAILLVGSTIGLINSTAGASETVFPAPAQLKECRELNIPSYQCNEKTILGHKCMDEYCGTSRPEPNPLLNSQMLVFWGVLGTIFGGIASALFFKTIKKATKPN